MYDYAFMPKVSIFKTIGGYKMMVTGVKDTILCSVLGRVDFSCQEDVRNSAIIFLFLSLFNPFLYFLTEYHGFIRG